MILQPLSERASVACLRHVLAVAEDAPLPKKVDFIPLKLAVCSDSVL